MRNATIRAALRLVMTYLEKELNPILEERRKWVEELDEHGNPKLTSDGKPRTNADYYDWRNRNAEELSTMVTMLGAVLDDLKTDAQLRSEADHWSKYFKHNPKGS